MEEFKPIALENYEFEFNKKLTTALEIIDLSRFQKQN